MTLKDDMLDVHNIHLKEAAQLLHHSLISKKYELL